MLTWLIRLTLREIMEYDVEQKTKNKKIEPDFEPSHDDTFQIEGSIDKIPVLAFPSAKDSEFIPAIDDQLRTIL